MKSHAIVHLCDYATRLLNHDGPKLIEDNHDIVQLFDASEACPIEKSSASEPYQDNGASFDERTTISWKFSIQTPETSFVIQKIHSDLDQFLYFPGFVYYDS